MSTVCTSKFFFAKFHDNHVHEFTISLLILEPAFTSFCFCAGNS